MKSKVNKLKRTFEQGSFDNEKLLDIIGKLDDLQAELEQARILQPNARLPTQYPRKNARTRK